MRLYLLRHGQARVAGPWSDADRPLSSAGESDVECAARALARLAIAPDAIATAPAVRCSQSAAILATHLGVPAVHVVQELGMDGGAARTVRALAAILPLGTLVAVGHEPTLRGLAVALLGRRPFGLRIEPGACVVLAVDALPPRARAELVALWDTAALRLLGGDSRPPS